LNLVDGARKATCSGGEDQLGEDISYILSIWKIHNRRDNRKIKNKDNEKQMYYI
jgi:hypothetical protein